MEGKTLTIPASELRVGDHIINYGEALDFTTANKCVRVSHRRHDGDISTKEDRYIVVENPAHQEDNGSAPKLVIDAFARTGVPELLDEVKRLRGQFEKIEDAALGGYLSPDLVASITHEALKVTP